MLLKGYDSSNGTFAGCSIFSNKDFESQQLQADVEILVDDFNFDYWGSRLLGGQPD